MSAISIRRYSSDDWPTLKAIMEANIPKYFAKHEVAELKNFLELHSFSYFIAEIDQLVIGSGGYHLPSETCGRLSWFLIRPGYQGQGTGRILAKYALAKLKAYPITSLEVWTSQYADRFFAKFGFTIESVVKNYWADGIHLYKMTKTPI